MGMSVRLGRRRVCNVSVAVGLLFASLLGAVAVSIETAGVSVAQSAQTRIDVQGNRRVEADTIRSYFRVNGAERLDSAKIDAALKALYATGLFQDVRITPGNGRILVSVVENPVVNKVAFEGNHKVKDEQLLAEIQTKPRGTFSRALVQGDVQRIVDIYQHNGRYDVRVEPKVIDLPNGRVDLVYEIYEGVKTGVEKIIFVGNNAFSDYRLRDVIKTGVTNWLSFLKSNDMFDADRIEVDRDLLRRFYLRNGFADVRIVSAVGEYDPEGKGFVITFMIDEGIQYHFGAVNILSSVPTVPGESLRYKLRVEQGRVYNADAIEKSVEEAAIEVARMGYPFASVRPRGERNVAARTVDVTFVVEEGPRVYVERINIRGNTRTRDYVIRREFDIVEGDPYNRALVDRAERRIKNLGYFKTVKITTEPGSAPDRIIVVCDVEEQSTGEFSFAGGYSTSDGILGEISIGERNLMGTGDIAKASVQYGQRSRGFDLSFVEPYLMGQRLAFGTDIFFHQTTSSLYLSYLSKTYGGDLKLGIPITDNLSVQARWTGYVQQISLPSISANCNNVNPNSSLGTFPDPSHVGLIDPATGLPFSAGALQQNCWQDGEASIAVQKELAQGAVFVSAPGYTLAYNTLDNNKSPTQGLSIEFKQDGAGAGGDVRNIKTTLDVRLYNEIFPDIVGMVRGQAGYATGWGGQDLRMLDHFQGGPNLVRGFAPAGFGPRDVTQAVSGFCVTGANNAGQVVPVSGGNFGCGENDALGGSMYWAATVEFQTPVPFAPKDFGMKLAWFADAGQLVDYVGPTSWAGANGGAGGSLVNSGNGNIRSSVGMGLLWDSPFGPLRFDLAYALTKEPYDHTQIFRFGGGTRF
jgi:outer membrane protein insertion porin family